MLDVALCRDKAPPFAASLGHRLVTELPTFVALEDVRLHLYRMMEVIGDDVAEGLCRACGRLPRLRRLMLNLSDNNLHVVAPGIHALGEATVLQELKLFLNRNPITDGSATVDALTSLPHRLTRLTVFHVGVTGCPLGYRPRLDLCSRLREPSQPSRCNVTMAVGDRW